MNILIACEETQRIATAFREIGENSFSADIQPCSGGHPEYHIQGDVLKIINGNIFYTQTGDYNYIPEWDLIIAHPPCTYLTNAATQCHNVNKTPVEKINSRTLKRIEAINFFMKFVTAKCDHIAIENPVGIMSTVYRQPDQIIHPYQFAESVEDSENYVTKRTCLWLKNLPQLKTNDLPKPGILYGVRPSGKPITWVEHISTKNRPFLRSKTFPGIAKAIVSQWGAYINS